MSSKITHSGKGRMIVIGAGIGGLTAGALLARPVA
jgi:phytoene dehydrogenase-like protein